MSQFSVEMATGVAHAHAGEHNLRARSLMGRIAWPFSNLINHKWLAESKEYRNGWLLRFAFYDELSVTVLVRDDDRVYFFGLSERQVLEQIVGTGSTVEERFLNPEGDAPRLYGQNMRALPPSDRRSLPPGR